MPFFPWKNGQFQVFAGMGLHVAVLGCAESMKVNSVKPVVCPLLVVVFGPVRRLVFRAVFGVCISTLSFSDGKTANSGIDSRAKQRKQTERAMNYPETFRAISFRPCLLLAVSALVRLRACLSVGPSVCLLACLSVCLSACLFACLSVCLFVPETSLMLRDEFRSRLLLTLH